MLCPIDNVQLHQHKKLGGGDSREDFYTTWMVLACPTCDRLYIEEYTARLLTAEELQKLEEAKK